MITGRMESLIREVVENDRELEVAPILRPGVATWYVVAYADGEIYEAPDVRFWIECLALGNRPAKTVSA